MTVKVGVHMAIIFCKGLRDKGKATTNYCSAIRGANSMKKVSEEEQRAGLAISTSNTVSVSLHGTSTDLMQVFGTISIPHATAMGQTRTNNDHGHSHKNLATDQKSKKKIDS